MKYWLTTNYGSGEVTASIDLTTDELTKLYKTLTIMNDLAYEQSGICDLYTISSANEKNVRTTVISDLHGNLPTLSECDLLCICGDVVPLNIQKDMTKSKAWFNDTFAKWINKLDCRKVIMIGGNHDQWLEQASDVDITMLEYNTKYRLKYLRNESYETMGIKIYGTPDCHIFGNWSFMYSDEKLKEKYENIPENLDILLIHDAPSNMYDVGTIMENDSHQDVGCKVLHDAIIKKKPRYTFCGHIHSGNHHLTEVFVQPNDLDRNAEYITTIANVSLLDESYTLRNKPLTLNIPLL